VNVFALQMKTTATLFELLNVQQNATIASSRVVIADDLKGRVWAVQALHDVLICCGAC
jgi:hypothetical protein